MKVSRFILLTILLCAASAVFAQGVGPAYQLVLEKAWEAPKLEQNLRVLSDEVAHAGGGLGQDETVQLR